MVVLVEVCTLYRELPDLLVERNGFNEALEVLAIVKRNLDQAKTLNDAGSLAELDEPQYCLLEQPALLETKVDNTSVLC